MTGQKKDLRCYYVNSMMIYDSEREHRELMVIKSYFDNVICPNNDIGNAQRGMRAYLKIVSWADIVVVSEYEGHIGVGAYAEVNYAFRHKIPVMCLRDGELHTVVDTTIVNRCDTRVKYAKLVLDK